MKKGALPYIGQHILGKYNTFTCVNFSRCENAVNFLTNWTKEINLRDLEGGLTPLHLAVISGNSRVVRKLLIKGSNRNIKVLSKE